MRFFLGIDGGGTRTTAWLADERGRVLARAVAGPSNPLKVGFEACEREILRATRAVVGALYERRKKTTVIDRRYKMPRIEAVVVGLAGVDRPPVHARVLRWLHKSIPAQHYLLTSDAAIALHAAIGNAPGIIVISGTGSIAYARDERGNVLRSGGWGTAFDDAGSGFDLGRRAIVAALHDYDGRGRPTLLGKEICRVLRLRDITQIILKSLTTLEIAALFPIVLKAASRRDLVAKCLLDGAADDLAVLARALVDRLGWRRRAFNVVSAGGVFTASARIRKMFSWSVRSFAPRARVILLHKQPVEGAIALAREISGA
ncbi:MAG: N-acetylglucosamine kinase [Terriglobia bacterium]